MSWMARVVWWLWGTIYCRWCHFNDNCSLLGCAILLLSVLQSSQIRIEVYFRWVSFWGKWKLFKLSTSCPARAIYTSLDKQKRKRKSHRNFVYFQWKFFRKKEIIINSNDDVIINFPQFSIIHRPLWKAQASLIDVSCLMLLLYLKSYKRFDNRWVE